MLQAFCSGAREKYYLETIVTRPAPAAKLLTFNHMLTQMSIFIPFFRQLFLFEMCSPNQWFHLLQT